MLERSASKQMRPKIHRANIFFLLATLMSIIHTHTHTHFREQGRGRERNTNDERIIKPPKRFPHLGMYP